MSGATLRTALPARVVELASASTPRSPGKLLADLGADVIVVEPPGGTPAAPTGPFVDDVEDPERSLWWWHYNTSKRGVVLDLDTDAGAEHFRRLAAEADIVLEGEPPGALADSAPRPPRPARRARGADLGVGHAVRPRPARAPHEPATDLTVLAGGGPVWSCGYDDHSLPAGARRRQPGLPHRQHVRGDGGAHRGAAPRRHRARPARRREHARGGQRHHRERQLRAGWSRGRRCSARPAGTRMHDDDACRRRCAAPTAATSPPASRPAHRRDFER